MGIVRLASSLCSLRRPHRFPSLAVLTAVRHASTTSKGSGRWKIVKSDKPYHGEGKAPVCYMIGWIHAKDKNLRHFRDIYLDHGIDVVSTIPTTPNVLFPSLTVDLIKDLRQLVEREGHTDRPKVVSAFSVGGFVYGTLLHQSTTEPDAKAFVDTTKLQVLDSLVDVVGIAAGLADALSPNNGLGGRSLIYRGVSSYLSFVPKSITDRYYESSGAFRGATCPAPSLWLYSTGDKIGNVKVMEDAISGYKKLGREVTTYDFGDTPHCEHFRNHPDVYTKLVREQLQKIFPHSMDD
mmetsp:Transcript_2375/g.4917  ORF Transcript_2375/g.4917 Transcript_2375/m.4917 type:complete len:294 (-) Transcript_2375:234-1115(-)